MTRPPETAGIARRGSTSPAAAVMPGLEPAQPVPKRRPLKVGVQLPEVEREVRWPEYLAMARRAEAVGFDSLWLGDHLLYRWTDGRESRGPWSAGRCSPRSPPRPIGSSSGRSLPPPASTSR